jgi:hypothetical protein
MCVEIVRQEKNRRLALRKMNVAVVRTSLWRISLPRRRAGETWAATEREE